MHVIPFVWPGRVLRTSAFSIFQMRTLVSVETVMQ